MVGDLAGARLVGLKIMGISSMVRRRRLIEMIITTTCVGTIIHMTILLSIVGLLSRRSHLARLNLHVMKSPNIMICRSIVRRHRIMRPRALKRMPCPRPMKHLAPRRRMRRHMQRRRMNRRMRNITRTSLIDNCCF